MALHFGICDKLEASGMLGVWMPDYHTVCECSPLLKMAPQALVGCVKARSSEKSFCSCLGSLGDSELDMMAAEPGRLQQR